MNTIIKLSIIVIIILGFGACENSTENSVKEVESQIVFFEILHQDSYWDNEVHGLIDVSNARGYGFIQANPLPSVNYFKLAKQIYNGPDQIIYRLNRCDLSSEMITSNLDPISLEVETSYGKIIGSISLPSKIDSLVLSEYDTLSIGQDFTIEWIGSDADFFSVFCSYEWEDENGEWQTQNFENYVSGNSVTYSGNYFIHDGIIDNIGVQPYNGPKPGVGVKGNMSGIGSGFLYYKVGLISHEGIIYVGNGSLSKRNRPKKEHNLSDKIMLEIKRQLFKY